MTAPKITFFGAGSTVFARSLLRDLYTFPELRDAEVTLMDIDPVRLHDTEVVAHRVAQQAGVRGKVRTTTDRREAVDGADYVVNMIQVGGYRPSTVIDFEIPKKYGLEQTIGDTLGIGGIMRALRTIPVMLDLGTDMEELCGDALLLNYTNPMASLCWAMAAATTIDTVGLCHSVQGTAAELASVLGIPAEEVDYSCAGINHMAFYLSLERGGEDLYPALRAVADAGLEPAWERVRFEMFRRLGYFVTESSEHFAEYTPYFIKGAHPDLLRRFNVPIDEYPARCEDQIADWEEMRAALVSDDPTEIDRYEAKKANTLPGGWERKLAAEKRDHPERYEAVRARILSERQAHNAGHSGEYGTLIIHSMETGQPRVINGNVANYGLIDNLPDGCCVEVPCLVDRNGIQPTQVGTLPPQLAALMMTNVNVQSLTVEAALTGRRDHVLHAAMLDPHTSSELPLDQIAAMVDELLEAHDEMIPAMA